MNTVTASFNTTVRQMTEMSQWKKQGVSRIQRHADGAASTTSPPFLQRNRTVRTLPLWWLHLTWPSHPGHSTVLLRSQSPSGKGAKLHTMTASNNRNHMPCLLFLPVHATHTSMLFLAHIPFVVHRTCDGASTIRCRIVLEPLLPGHSAQNQTIFDWSRFSILPPLLRMQRTDVIRLSITTLFSHRRRFVSRNAFRAGPHQPSGVLNLFEVMGNNLCIRYLLTAIMSTIIRNVPIFIAPSR